VKARTLIALRIALARATARPAPPFGIALAFMLMASPASAFCRSTTCRDCPRDPDTGCVTGGKPVAWPSSCVSFSLAHKALGDLDHEVARELMIQAFEPWQNVRCPPDDLPPSINVSDSFGDVLCTRVEYNPDQGNANAIMYRKEWTYAGAGQSLGITKLSYDDRSGHILDADMEINASLSLLLPDGSVPKPKAVVVNQYDLLSILTHEAGHFLGLDHSRVPGSIMKVALGPSEVSRELGADDVAAICAAYPPDEPAICEDRPRGGFSAQCGMDPTSGGACSVEPPGDTSSPKACSLGMLLAGVALLVRQCRRHGAKG
jgi:hypothetical protein